MSLPRIILHLEGAVVLVLATAAFFRLGFPWWWYLILMIAPDLSLLALAAGPRVGGIIYDLIHTTIWPLIIFGVGWWTGTDVAVAVGLGWLAHLGMDRMFGFGLRYPDGRKETHFGRI
jgi:hypothetical protein